MADMSKMETIGMLLKYKNTTETLMHNGKRSNSSSCLEIESSTMVGTQGAPWHRRSASDSLEMVKRPYTMKPGSSGTSTSKGFSKPFNGEVAPIQADDNKINKIENSSSPSEKDTGFDESSAVKTEPNCVTQYTWWRNIDPKMDPKKMKRILANRQSAQRSRLRKLEYMTDLEKQVNDLQAKVAVISPQVSYYDRKRLILRMENNTMKQRIASLMNEKIFKEAQFQVLKEEGQRLKQLYALQQQLKQEHKGMVGLEPLPEQIMNMNSTQPGPEQILNMDSINLDSLNCFM